MYGEARAPIAQYPFIKVGPLRDDLLLVISEVLPGFYDVDGQRIWRPSEKRHGALCAVPLGPFIDQPLKVVCQDLDEIRAFLATCRFVPDRVQFGVEDYWMAPQQFEQTRQGDCEDFALWTWRQLIGLGYSARFVAGKEGTYQGGHAWVTFRDRNKAFLVEPQLARVSERFPRLDTLKYEPIVSVAAEQSHVKYFQHVKRAHHPGFRDVAPLIPEWLSFRLRRWLDSSGPNLPETRA